MHSMLLPPFCAAQKFPVELWMRIFSNACTDDGRTGRALSLVSRYIHRASASHKLQSVFITSLPQLIAFTKTVEHTAAPLRRVHTLTFTIDPSANTPKATRLQSLLRAQQSTLVFSTLSQILSLLSRSLHCLSTDLQSLPAYQSTFIPPLPLPSLTHLFLSASYFPTNAPAYTVSPLPSLRTIELVLCSPTYSAELMPYLAALAPGLVELTICAASPAQAVLVLGGGYWTIRSASPGNGVFADAPRTLESVRMIPRSEWNEEWEAFSCSLESENEKRITVANNSIEKY